jgi:predicted AlkP superfamily phosphohydrolase/phosphomutase
MTLISIDNPSPPRLGVRLPPEQTRGPAMPTTVLFIGMDAADVDLLERFASEGALPEFAALRQRARVATLANPLDTLPGAIWPELMTGRPGGETGLYYHPEQIHTGEARPRRVDATEVDPRTFWTAASSAGRRVAVVDIPQAPPAHALNGVHVCEWGLHDPAFTAQSAPLALLGELRARHGAYPVPSCDDHALSSAAYDDLLDRLLAAAERKTALLLDVLGRERWDLFACAFSETHCGGHQFWHFGDARSPRHPAAASARHRGAVASIYRAVTAGVARLVAAAGDQTRVVLVASHGMGLYVGGPQLLRAVLTRLGMIQSPESRIRSRLPSAVVGTFRSIVPVGWRIRLHEAMSALPQPLEAPGTRAVDVENNRCGGIRLNLRGREPHGCVAPGAEADALVDELRRELLALRHPELGEPIVASVVTATEAFGPSHHPDVPDVIVVFRDDLGAIEACTSPRVGLVSVSLHKPHLPRTGDHRGPTALLALGPGTTALAPTGRAIDVAPTVLDLLDVPTPVWMRGRSLLCR